MGQKNLLVFLRCFGSVFGETVRGGFIEKSFLGIGRVGRISLERLVLEFRVRDVGKIVCVVKSVVGDIGKSVGIACFY